MKSIFTGTALVLATLIIAGCTSKTAPRTAEAQAEQYLMKERPADAQDVADVVKTAQHNDEVTLVGRIGGSTNPWVEDLAAFDIVDPQGKCSHRETHRKAIECGDRNQRRHKGPGGGQ